jgi:DNA invertase Pin-like site-specific DNA recombinase
VNPRSSARSGRTTPQAAIYCRISLSRFGDTIKVDDQEKLCRDVARLRGWAVNDAHVYKDNSKSAWRRDRKRPDWDAMLEAIGRNEVDAIIVYHGDRLIRQPWDLELLIRLADEKGMHLASPTGERDLDNPDDRYILRIEAAGNCRESDNTSRRLKRHYDRLAEQGIVRLGGRGGRAFGFEPDGLTVRQDDAAMIREAAGHILRGDSVLSICRSMNERGSRTTAGNEWGHMALKRLMLRPRLAGLAIHRGQIAGTAAWPAILDRDTWESVCAVLEKKTAGYGFTTNARKYLLSGLAKCGTCDDLVVVRHNTRSAALLGYGCINPSCAKKVHRQVRSVDLFVEGAVIARLQDDRIRQQMDTPVQRDLAGELAALEARRLRKLSDFAEDDSPLAADVLRVTVGRIDERIAEVRAAMTDSRSSQILDGLWGIDLTGWRSLDLARQRAAVAALLRVTILPSAKRGPGFDPASVRLDPA